MFNRLTEMYDKKKNIKSILIVDGNFYLIRQYSVLAKEYIEDSDFNQQTFYESLKKSFNQAIYNSKFTTNTDCVIIVWDGPPYKRLSLIPEYKQNRISNEESIKKINNLIELVMIDSELSLDDKNHQITIYQRQKEMIQVLSKMKKELYLDSSNYFSLKIEGCEGDDLAYYLSKVYSNKGLKVVLSTSDSDWKYMLDKNICLYNPIKKSVITYKEVDSIYHKLIEKYNPCYIKAIYELWIGSHNNVPIKLNKRKKKIWEYLDEALSGNDIVLQKYIKILSPELVSDLLDESLFNRLFKSDLYSSLLLGTGDFIKFFNKIN